MGDNLFFYLLGLVWHNDHTETSFVLEKVVISEFSKEWAQEYFWLVAQETNNVSVPT